jgi:nucleoside-diphosphate-sugar epimerase
MRKILTGNDARELRRFSTDRIRDAERDRRSAARPYRSMLGTCCRGELPMRVLVTGGTGYVGSHTVAALAGRDVGALHAAVLRPGLGARRYLLGSPAVEVTEVSALLGELTGRRLRQQTAPDWMVQQSGRLADRAQRLLPVRLPVSAEQAALPLSIPAGVVVDDSATRQELAVERRELRETLADTVRWLAARGLITARQAGALAG